MKKVYITNILPLLREEVYQYYYDRVGEYRQKKADKLISAIDKARSVGVGAVLRFAVEDSTKYNFDTLTIEETETGKPFFKDTELHFSLSHSGNYAVCAISDSPIGVDIEEDKELPERIKKRFAKDVTEWTKKEAKGKLTGKGFFDNTPDKYVYTHKKTDGMLITVCSDEKITSFLAYHLPMPL